VAADALVIFGMASPTFTSLHLLPQLACAMPALLRELLPLFGWRLDPQSCFNSEK
jgi:hypothetical protein